MNKVVWVRPRRPVPMAAVWAVCAAFVLCGAAIAVSREAPVPSGAEQAVALRAEIDALAVERDALLDALVSRGPIQLRHLLPPPAAEPVAVAQSVSRKVLAPAAVHVARSRVSTRAALRDKARISLAAGLTERAVRIAVAADAIDSDRRAGSVDADESILAAGAHVVSGLRLEVTDE